MEKLLTKKYLDNLTFEVIGAAIEVHKYFGQGLLESIYHEALKEELINRKINFQTELKIPVIYKNKPLNVDFRCDLFVRIQVRISNLIYLWNKYPT